MPNPSDYLKGFNLHQGMILSGYKLVDIDIKHETVSTYHEYKYPIVMFWTNVDPKFSQQDLIYSLSALVSNVRTVYSRYGNPYSCNFGTLDHHYKDNEHLIVNSIGHCTRI
jgi:hypothetical protein